MKYIAQLDSYGCGVACVANILERTYKEALELFEVPQNATCKGFYCKDIVHALAKSQNSYHYYYIKPRKRSLIYKNKTIVFIKRSNKYPAGHYLVRKNGVWVDSWVNFPGYPRRAGERKRLPGVPIYAIQLMY